MAEGGQPGIGWPPYAFCERRTAHVNIMGVNPSV